VPKGTKITNDSVSLEAGRKKGSVKKSRPIFSELIEAIDKATTENASPVDEAKAQLAKAKAEVEKYRALWEEELGRKVSLINQLWSEREAWANEKAALSTGKVTPIQSGRNKKTDNGQQSRPSETRRQSPD
jgi:hypothetical protein